MIKYLDIKGCSVVDGAGRIWGSVLDCVFDCRTKRIYSVLVVKRNPRTYAYVLRFGDIGQLGNNIIIREKPYRINKSIITKSINKMFNGYLDRIIIDNRGYVIGEMKDAIIDENTGLIKAVICSRGFVDDMVEGRRVVLVNEETIFGQDKIIVEKSTLDIYNDMSIWKLTRG